MTKVLITYASKYGSTAEAAQAIAATLPDSDVVPVAEASLEGYEAVILGAPLYGGEWLPEAVAFVRDNRAALAAMPVALFVVAIRLHHDDEGMREAVLRAIAPAPATAKPVAVGMFAGRLLPDKLGAIERMQVQSKGLPTGDYLDLDAVRAWAAEVGPQLG